MPMWKRVLLTQHELIPRFLIATVPKLREKVLANCTFRRTRVAIRPHFLTDIELS